MQRTLINVTFHGIGRPSRALEAGEAAVWVDLQRFTATLDLVAGREDVRVTFDDGNRSDLTRGLPALRARGLHATFFVVAGRLDEPEFLSTADVRELREAGMTIGSHGLRHRPWRRLDDAELEEELVRSRAVLEDVVGAPVTAAACPFGSYDRRVLRALQRAGYEHVFTSDRGPARAGDWLQARTTITQETSLGDVLGPRPASLKRRVELVAKRWR